MNRTVTSPVPTAVRRAVAAAIALALSGAACGGDDPSASSPSTSAPASVAPAGTDAAVADDPVDDTATTPAVDAPSSGPDAPSSTTGAVDVDPPDLGRVVSLSEEFVLADLLALDVVPIASTATVESAGFQGLDAFDTTGIEVLPQTTLSLEYLASLQPDTIVTLQFWIDQVGPGVLEAIADVIVIPDGLAGAARIEALGDLIGRPARAAEIAAEVEAAEEAARARLAASSDGAGCSLSLATVYPGPVVAAFVDGPWEIPSAILSLGCELSPGTELEADANGRVYLSDEQLGLLDQELLVLLQNESVDGESDALSAVQASPLWRSLPAVVSGEVVVIDRLGYPGALGLVRFYADFAAAGGLAG